MRMRDCSSDLGTSDLDKSRLVVAPLPDPPPMKWNRRKKVLCVPAQRAVHEMSQRLGNAGPAAIFELQHDTTRDIAIGDGGAGTVIFRRMGEADRKSVV